METNEIMNDSRNVMGSPSTGRVEQLLLRWLGKKVKVSSVEAWSEKFRLIELEGEALRGISWNAGQKIQIPLQGMRLTRTYTPISWDADRGRTSILVWNHGAAPGATWSQSVLEGTDCQIMGPRKSVDIPLGHERILLFGDETAIGLAAALQFANPGRPLSVVLEVTSQKESQLVLDRLGLDSTALFVRIADESHLNTIEAKLAADKKIDTLFVLAGRAPAIKHMRRALVQSGIASKRIYAKVYWAPGRTGLD
ncbi:siderophore-interacting protein [Methylovorus sp. SPW-M1]